MESVVLLTEAVVTYCAFAKTAIHTKIVQRPFQENFEWKALFF